jgi:hypothetical protein
MLNSTRCEPHRRLSPSPPLNVYASGSQSECTYLEYQLNQVTVKKKGRVNTCSSDIQTLTVLPYRNSLLFTDNIGP